MDEDRDADGLRLRFWGVRGSCPSPGPDTAAVGGNTSCVELRAGSDLLILDGGTGLRALGDELGRSSAVEASILFSHVHWDHIQGIPFFAPIFRSETRLSLYGAPEHMSLEDVMHKQMGGPNFPVPLDRVPAQLSFHAMTAGDAAAVGPFRVLPARLNHPNGVLGYRIEIGGRSIVYATDTEHLAGGVDQRLVELAAGADLLIYDAQYTPAEYAGELGPSRVGWGHSTWAEGVRVARAAGVGQLVLFHHDPAHDDAVIDAIEARAAEELPGTVAAREGLTIELEANLTRRRRYQRARSTG
ncbi:MAG TPA: MBL fold metallo-hydrolase [Kofleriaceae bacterium]|nr:MBL fold metallo-hydrolase [Kofleriaceae bacterium]